MPREVKVGTELQNRYVVSQLWGTAVLGLSGTRPTSNWVATSQLSG